MPRITLPGFTPNRQAQRAHALERALGVDLEAAVELARSATTRPFGPGEVLLAQGDGDRTVLYVVESGFVEITLHRAGSKRAVRTIGRGRLLGEMAPLTGSDRCAEAVGRTDGVLLALDAAAVQAVLRRQPVARRAVDAAIEERRTQLDRLPA